MEWGHKIYFWLLIVIPIMLIWGIYFFKSKRNNFNLPFGVYFNQIKKNTSYIKLYIKFSFFILALLLLILTLSAPAYGEKSKIVKKSGIDIIIALDISRSMLAEDISPSRIDRAKMELSLFIKKLKSDRVGLIAFAGLAYPQSPLTIDYSIIKTFLASMNVGDIPVGGTNIEMAINTAINMFDDATRGGNRSKVLILLTDGESHDGKAIKAAKKAAEKGIVIYTIGIGSKDGELIPIRDKNGKNKGYLKSHGKPILTKLNDKLLKKISSVTDGKYYSFENNSQDLEGIITKISSMEKKTLKEEFRILKEERYQIPLSFALFFLLLASLISERSNKKERKS